MHQDIILCDSLGDSGSGLIADESFIHSVTSHSASDCRDTGVSNLEIDSKKLLKTQL